MDQFALTWLHLPISMSISCFHVYRDVCERELVERHRLPAPGSFPTSMYTFPVVLRLQLEIFLHRGSTHHSQYIYPTLPVTVCQVFVLLHLNKVVPLFYFSFCGLLCSQAIRLLPTLPYLGYSATIISH